MKRTTTTILTTVILSIALTSVFAFDFKNNNVTSMDSQIPFAAEAAQSSTHNIVMEAVKMPDGLYAYRMVSYNIDGGSDLVGKVYTDKPSIPGPTIILTEGDDANVTLINSACDENFVNGPAHPLLGGASGITRSETSMIGIHVHGVHYDITDDATYGRMNMNGDSGALCNNTINYHWVASSGTSGAWPYHDHTFSINEVGAEELGLFGTVIVNPANGKVNGLVGQNGKIETVDLANVEKEFVLWMVSSETLGRSIFYGNEIDYSTTNYQGNNGWRETPLWTNPNLITTEGGIYRIHVLGLGDETHAFHLHGHRWTEDIHEKSTFEDIIDVKEITPLQRHTFIIKASDNDTADETPDTEGWMYHCHVLDHMKQGMTGMMTVLSGSDDLPVVGAVFTLSDEPGLWMKTLNAGFLDDLDDILAGSSLSNSDDEVILESLNPDPDAGTGFPIDYLGVLSPEFGDSQGRSLAVINTGETVLFGMKDSQTKHTITTLIYPTAAQPENDQIGGNGILSMANYGFFDQQLGIRGSTFITNEMGKPIPLEVPGLYVFVCKIHPYMFGAVIVDDPSTTIQLNNVNKSNGGAVVPLLDLSPELTILTRTDEFPTHAVPSEGVPLALLKTFYIITDPSNWKDYTQDFWKVNLPPAPLTITGNEWVFLVDQDTADGIVTLTNATITGSSLTNPTIGAMPLHEIPMSEPDLIEDTYGIGEVWVNTQFERTVAKNHQGTPYDKPGTITVVNTSNWEVERKIALPEINMNHPHNMWTDTKNEVIYQTEWFGNEMAIIDRDSGELIKEVFTGQSPSHVMTSPTTGKIYVAVNGEETVNEFDDVTYEMTRQISTGFRSHPHGHWISSDGKYIVTPDFIGLKASIIDLEDNTVDSTGLLIGPIATGMKSGDREFFTADFLGNSNTSIDASTGIIDSDRTIDWVLDYGVGLPIQTPISPDDKWMVTALTLGSKIGVVNVENDPPTVTILDCDPGCHGVQWGAKANSDGYLAYVSSKFSNALIVVDPEADSGPAVIGKILLANDDVDTDDRAIGYRGMGGQGVLAIPNVYNGWIDETVDACEFGSCGDITTYIGQLSDSQKEAIVED